MTDLPDTWADEPWPLDDPTPTPGLRPSNWSDTHTDPPQVADLADEAWQYAMDHGCSMEQALAALQGREAYRAGLSSGQTLSVGMSLNLEPYRKAFSDMGAAIAKVADVLSNRVDVDALIAEVEQMAEEAQKPKVRYCPSHGPMAKGGYCRRCSR